MAKKEKPKKSKEQKPERYAEKLELRHAFSDAEQNGMSKDISRLLRERDSLAEQAKASAQSWKSKIKNVSVQIEGLADKIGNGFEMRITECLIELDRKSGKKKIFTRDGKTLLEEQDMTEQDYARLPYLENAVKPGEGLTNVGEAIEAAAEQSESPADEDSAD